MKSAGITQSAAAVCETDVPTFEERQFQLLSEMKTVQKYIYSSKKGSKQQTSSDTDPFKYIKHTTQQRRRPISTN